MELFVTSEPDLYPCLIQTDRESLAQLRTGDIVEFSKYNGEMVVGIYVTKGFWDGRDKSNPEYYYFDVDGKFVETNGHRMTWRYLGHDFTYCPPDKDEDLILEKLTNRLSKVPFPKRLETFRTFQNEYPYVSYEYHPYVNDSVWDNALVSVTTKEEVMDNLNHFMTKASFPSAVAKYVAQHIFPLPTDRWHEEIVKIRWAEPLQSDHTFVYRFQNESLTVYTKLYDHLLHECTTPQELMSLLSIRGSTFESTNEPVPEGKVWVVEESTQQLLCG